MNSCFLQQEEIEGGNKVRNYNIVSVDTMAMISDWDCVLKKGKFEASRTQQKSMINQTFTCHRSGAKRRFKHANDIAMQMNLACTNVCKSNREKKYLLESL